MQVVEEGKLYLVTQAQQAGSFKVIKSEIIKHQKSRISALQSALLL